MGGVATHIGAGLIIGLIVHLIHYRLEFSLMVFIGNILPDAIRQTLTAIKQGTIAIFAVDSSDPFFKSLATVTHSPTNWALTGIFVISALGFLYHFHYIKKKTWKEYDEVVVFLILGVLIHLILDVLVIEKSLWI
jgi:hypothetical protein